jgi:hypothetical protein
MTQYVEMDREEIEREFKCALDPAIELLFSKYDVGCYEGSAVVIFRLNGVLYENHASHCSCFGLEGQWEPEETTVEALKKTCSFCFVDDGKAVFNQFLETLA